LEQLKHISLSYFVLRYRKSKEYIYNYVDRVRFAEGSFPDYKCPSRGSGWRHNKSISHLDLATSCHSSASGLNHWPSAHPSRHHQLRHSRSLDYNHIDRCKDALDIAEYYWRFDHDPEVYDEEEEEEIDIEPVNTGSQLKYVSEHHHYRDFKCADENYHHSGNNLYQTDKQQKQQQLQLPITGSKQTPSRAVLPSHQSPSAASGAVTAAQAFEFASDSCSLRRSRSLAVIREETFSDLQISSSNGSRRSQLIPRARLVNRGYFRERDRLIYSNNKPHHHHHVPRDKLGNCSGSATGGGVAGVLSSAPSLEADEQSNESVAETCDSHQQQQQQLKNYKHQQQLQKSHNQSQPQQHQLHYQPLYHNGQQQTSICSVNTTTSATSVANDYYDHLKRLDKLALGLVAEQLHPWHNDKSDLESLNSDYFKNSLHQ
uniref:Uncharacterized protein n=1 Tax=Stomoxys calcitrans TaxID=35570 RepID=A0A1I8NP76_STOCA